MQRGSSSRVPFGLVRLLDGVVIFYYVYSNLNVRWPFLRKAVVVLVSSTGRCSLSSGRRKLAGLGSSCSSLFDENRRVGS